MPKKKPPFSMVAKHLMDSVSGSLKIPILESYELAGTVLTLTGVSMDGDFSVTANMLEDVKYYDFLTSACVVLRQGTNQSVYFELILQDERHVIYVVPFDTAKALLEELQKSLPSEMEKGSLLEVTDFKQITLQRANIAHDFYIDARYIKFEYVSSVGEVKTFTADVMDIAYINMYGTEIGQIAVELFDEDDQPVTFYLESYKGAAFSREVREGAARHGFTFEIYEY